MSDRDFDELVDEMKRTHNPPPPVPRDRMWARIQERRQAARSAEMTLTSHSSRVASMPVGS